MVYAPIRINTGNLNHKILWNFEIKLITQFQQKD